MEAPPDQETRETNEEHGGDDREEVGCVLNGMRGVEVEPPGNAVPGGLRAGQGVCGGQEQDRIGVAG